MHMSELTHDLMQRYIQRPGFHGTLDSVLECPSVEMLFELPHVDDLPLEQCLQRAKKLRKEYKTKIQVAQESSCVFGFDGHFQWPFFGDFRILCENGEFAMHFNVTYTRGTCSVSTGAAEASCADNACDQFEAADLRTWFISSLNFEDASGEQCMTVASDV